MKRPMHGAPSPTLPAAATTTTNIARTWRSSPSPVSGTGRHWVRLVVSSCRTTTAWPQYSLSLIEIAAAVCRTRVTHSTTRGTSSIAIVNSSSAEFSLALRKLELRTRLKKSERYALAQFLDFDKDGTIDYEVRGSKTNTAYPILFLLIFVLQEFVRGFKVVDKTGDKDWQRRILQRMASALFHNRQSLQSAFRLLDQNNSGTLEVCCGSPFPSAWPP